MNGALYLALPVIGLVAVMIIGRFLRHRPDSHTALADLCRSADHLLAGQGHRVDWVLQGDGTVAGQCAGCGGTATIVAAERPGTWDAIYGPRLADDEVIFPCGAGR